MSPSHNRVFQGTKGDDSLDFGSNPYFAYTGVDYRTLGGNDRVVGTGYGDTFTLGSDAEYIDGGNGSDTVIYSNSNAGVSVDLNTVTQHGGYAEGDRLYRIESVTGSQYADALFGNAGANVLDGQGGNDRIYGGDGDDTLVGGDGKDFLSGDAGNDNLYGGTGDDTLRGGAGADGLDGGAGVDTADYSDAPAVGSVFGITGIFANLQDGHGYIGDAEGDTYTGIENVRGSSYNDWIIGNAQDNALYGGAGDNSIVGGAGGDFLDGGAGIDMLSYYGSSAGVSINLGTNQATGGDATGDTIMNFESVIGSEFVDQLIGTDGDNWISGNSGNDLLIGMAGNDRIEGGAGNDLMIGGADNDTFVFYTGHWQPGSQEGNDVIADFNVNTDHLEFSGSGVHGMNDLHFFQAGSGTIITYNEGSEAASITLLGVDMNQLLAHAQADFMFV